MSKITKSYIEARRDGIKWLNSQKRDYSTGVNILTRSGYKGFVAARLARQGEKPHTREKLEYEIRQMIKVWYHPDDPRFENIDLADDAVPGNDGRPETVKRRQPLLPLRKMNWRVKRMSSLPIRRLLPKSSMISVNAIMSVHASTGYLPNWVRPIRRLYVQNARILSLV